MLAKTYQKKFILGTVQFGLNYGINNRRGKIEKTLAHEILNYAYDHDINSLDTADAYGDSQKTIGDFHSANPGKRFKVLTKFKNIEPESLVEHTRKTIELLNVEQLDCLSLHDFNELKNSSTFMGYNQLKEMGLTKKIGVSVYTPEECREALSNDLVDTVQIPFNILDNENRWNDVFKFKNQLKRPTEIHSRSCFLQGLLYKSARQIETDTPYLKDLTLPLQLASNGAHQFNKTVAEYSLNYCFQNPDISGVLIGVDSLEQLQQNLMALETILPFSAFEKIKDVKVANSDLLNPSKWTFLKENSR